MHSKIKFLLILGKISACFPNLDQTAKIWLAESGSQPLVNYTGHNGSVNSVAFRHEGSRTAFSECHVYSHPTFLTCSGDRSSHIWRVNFDQISERLQNENDSQSGISTNLKKFQTTNREHSLNFL